MYYRHISSVFFNQVFNKNQFIVMLKSAAGRGAGGWLGEWASTFGFRSITLVCFGLLTPNLLYRQHTSRRSFGLLPRCL